MNAQKYIEYNALLLIFWRCFDDIDNVDKPFWWVKIPSDEGGYNTFVLSKN